MKEEQPEQRGSLALLLSMVVVAVAVTAALVGMVRVKSQAIEVGYRIQSLRTQVVQLEQQQSALEVEKTTLSRPTRLAAIARNDLKMVPPDPTTSLTFASTVAPAAPVNP